MRSLDEESVKEKSVKEEQTVYAQAIHYTTRMVSVLIPMNFKPDKTLTDHHSDMISNSISNSVADTDSLDAKSGFDNSDTPNDNGHESMETVAREAQVPGAKPVARRGDSVRGPQGLPLV